MPVAQFSFSINGVAAQELAGLAIEHVEEAVAVGLQHQLARLASDIRGPSAPGSSWRPSPTVVGGELEMPLHLAGVGIERDSGIGVEVVALAAAP